MKQTARKRKSEPACPLCARKQPWWVSWERQGLARILTGFRRSGRKRRIPSTPELRRKTVSFLKPARPRYRIRVFGLLKPKPPTGCEKCGLAHELPVAAYAPQACAVA